MRNPLRGGGALVLALLCLAAGASPPAPRSSSKPPATPQTVPDPASAAPPAGRPYAAGLAQEQNARERGLTFNKIIRGDARRPKIALTFDDGPHPVLTLELLDVLRHARVPATFFVVGRQAERSPDLVRLEVAEGHEVGNHTYDHVSLTRLPPTLVPYELDECDAVIRRTTGASARFFRPPGGEYDGAIVREAAAHGYITTLWTDDPGDFTKPGPDVILRRSLDRLEPGAIILLHDGIPQTVQMLPAFINEARRRGYEFVTMSDLARGN